MQLWPRALSLLVANLLCSATAANRRGASDQLVLSPNASLAVPWKSCKDCLYPACSGTCDAESRCTKVTIVRPMCSCQKVTAVRTPVDARLDFQAKTWRPKEGRRLMARIETRQVVEELSPEQEIRLRASEASLPSEPPPSSFYSATGLPLRNLRRVMQKSVSIGPEASSNPRNCFQCVWPGCNAKCPGEFECKRSLKPMVVKSLCACVKFSSSGSQNRFWNSPDEQFSADGEMIMIEQRAKQYGIVF